MSLQNTFSTWILYANLRLFLERVSLLIKYRFVEWDWDAIRFGVQDADVYQGNGYEYELNGKPTVKLIFTYAGDLKRVSMTIETEEHTSFRIDALARIMQYYEETKGTQDIEILIQVAFLPISLPDADKIVACDAAHLARCPECQEAFSFFRGKHWSELLRTEEPLPRYYADLILLTPKARRFFFPAYLARAIRDKDTELLEIALEHVGQEAWTPLQQELIEFARYLPQLQSGDKQGKV